MNTENANLYISSLSDFDKWWYSEGGNPPLQGDDCEEHTKRMCRIAWDNGASKEAEKLAMTSGNNMPDRHELQKYGKHPAPCAKFCESNAYESQIRRLNNEASCLAEEINQQAMKMAAVESQRDELLTALRKISEVKDQSGMAVDLLTDIHFIVTDALSKAGAA